MARYAAAPPGVVEQRLRELDREWDTERLNSTASGLALLLGLQLVSILGAEWLVLPAVFAICLLLHGLLRWTPALPLLRSMGFRTPQEIALERHVLQGLRDDLRVERPALSPQDRDDLARFENEGGAPAGRGVGDGGRHSAPAAPFPGQGLPAAEAAPARDGTLRSDS
jgi:hypothetical protein